MSITLYNRKRREIVNEQCTELSPFYKNSLTEYERKYGHQEGFTFRTDVPTGMDDCHGLVFAGRCTRILPTDEIRKIIADDGYREVSPEEVKPGGIILYYTEAEEIEHSAIVIVPPSTNY